MNLEAIPKTFWHAVSLSVLIFTVGFVWVSYQTGNLTLKYKDLEIATARASNEIGEARGALEARLKQSEEQIKHLKVARDEAEKAFTEAREKLAEAQKLLASQGATDSAKKLDAITKVIGEAEIARKNVLLSEPRKSDTIDDLARVQKKLDNLDVIQKEIREKAVRKW